MPTALARRPLHDHLIGLLKASPGLFCDETRCPVLDPGFMWAIACDDRMSMRSMATP